jgi:lipoate-protein ligase A
MSCSLPAQPSRGPWSARKVEELIKVDQARRRRLSVLKRFTGGGTVVVDADTIFTTLIMQVRPQKGIFSATGI